MKSTLIVCLCILVVAGCKRSDEVVAMNYRTYKEGPHVILDEGSADVVFFTKSDRTWTMEKEFLNDPDSARLQVDNPVFDAFPIHLRLTTDTVPSVYPSASKITVVADIEGNFAGLYSLLLAQHVIDQNGNWIYGNGHLVMLGDLFDRGPDVTPILWLLYKLEAEALISGGNVHTLLGNHEIMIFNGDLRYVHKKYKSQSKQTGFEYPELYISETVLGMWLRNKPAVIKIGNMLFSHAGISPEVLALDLDLQEINALVRQQNLKQPSGPRTSHSETIFGTNGIFWYRGWVDDPHTANILDTLLDAYHAAHMIIGHTIVSEIRASFNYKLIAVDLHQPKNINRSPVRALYIEGNNFYEIDNRGERKPIASN
jgi:calcineurin-like phosphoesterase family protein